MIASQKIVTIFVEYDPNSEITPDVEAAADAAFDVGESLDLKRLVEERLVERLTPEQLRLIRVTAR